MGTRIKFIYDGNTKNKMKDAKTGVNRQPLFIKNNKEVDLYIDFTDFYFEILEKDGSLITKGGKTKNRAVLLRQAKRALVKLGCTFKKELRHRERKEEGN